MAGEFRVSVTLSGWRELAEHLKPPEDLYADPWRQAVEEMAEVGYTAALARAPIGEEPRGNYRPGQTALRMQKKMQRRKVPNWAVVKTTANRNGYPYPRLTNFSPYAQSRYRTGTNVHRYWFTNAIKRVDQALSGILQKAGDEIERRWAALH